MKKTYIVGVDDSGSNSRALEYAVKMADKDTTLHIIHVLEWSPYSFLTVEELNERHKRRGEELKRANAAVIDPILEKLKGSKYKVTGDVRYGGIAETISKCSDDVNGELIFVNRSGESKISARLFGSVPGALVQIANVPVIVVP